MDATRIETAEAAKKNKNPKTLNVAFHVKVPCHTLISSKMTPAAKSMVETVRLKTGLARSNRVAACDSGPSVMVIWLSEKSSVPDCHALTMAAQARTAKTILSLAGVLRTCTSRRPANKGARVIATLLMAARLLDATRIETAEAAKKNKNPKKKKKRKSCKNSETLFPKKEKKGKSRSKFLHKSKKLQNL